METSDLLQLWMSTCYLSYGSTEEISPQSWGQILSVVEVGGSEKLGNTWGSSPIVDLNLLSESKSSFGPRAVRIVTEAEERGQEGPGQGLESGP